MGFEDRDYFRSRPRFKELGSHGPATIGMIIAIVAGYLGGLVVADTTSFTSPEFWDAAAGPGSKQSLSRSLFVLTARDIAPWQAGYAPGYWKLLASWLVAPGIIAAVIDAILIYFAGRALEETLGWKRFLALVIGACIFASLMAGLSDPLILPGREQIVIMGSSPGIFACFTVLLWTVPNRPSIFGWPVKRVLGGVLAIVAVYSFLAPLFSGDNIALSPTHLAWGIAAGAIYMSYFSKGSSKAAAATSGHRETWSSEYASEIGEDSQERKAREQERKALERMQREALEKQAAEDARKAQLDGILDKINVNGIDSLSRAERRFLEDESKRKQGK